MKEITKITDEVDSKNQVVEEVAKPDSDSKFDSLSNKESLREALKIHREPKEKVETPTTQQVTAPTNKEVKTAVDAEIEPPSEFNLEEKKAWANKDIAGIQKGFRRLNESRTREVSQAQTEARVARENAKSNEDIDTIAKPFIDAAVKRGQTRAQAISNVFALVEALQKADPNAAKAELKTLGIDLDKAPGQPTNNNSDLEAKIDALQKRHDQLDNEKREAYQAQLAQSFESVFANMRSQKTRTGECPFPDLLDTSEEGMELAKQLGSRTNDPWFIKRVKAQFPDADFAVIVREAYKSAGGRVLGEPVQVSKDNPKQIEKSRRAAASTPGRIVTRSEHSNLIGKLGNKEAIRAARAYHREH